MSPHYIDFSLSLDGKMAKTITETADAIQRASEDFKGHCPDGHFKFPHLWPPQIPPGKTVRIMTVQG